MYGLCYLAFLAITSSNIEHSALSLNSPLVSIASPCWAARDAHISRWYQVLDKTEVNGQATYRKRNLQ
jgi:NADH:ubiquinone oxidoreductase subunit 6 (subunit J)